MDDQSTERGWARGVSLYALIKVILSDAGCDEEYSRMETVAIDHIPYRGFRENSATILYLLKEKIELSETAQAALDAAIEHPLYREVFMRHLETSRKNFAAGRKG